MQYELMFIGDSITKGTYTAYGEKAPNSLAKPNFADIIKDEINATETINLGSNGISYSSLSPVLAKQSIEAVCGDFACADNIFVLAGTNDFGTNVLLGNYGDKKGESFYGAVSYVFDTINKKNHDSIIFAVLPIRRKDEKVNEIGNSLDDYREVIRLCAEKNGVKVIDGRELKINPNDKNDRESVIYDGVHINEQGHRMFAEFLLEKTRGILRRR